MQGTLDVLILRTLLFSPQHGQGIARAIQETSGHELLVDHGALYPALQRLESQEVDYGEMGNLDKQSPCALLQHHESGTRAAGHLHQPLAAAGCRHGARARSG